MAMAKLFAHTAQVRVGPPLFDNKPRFGFIGDELVPIWLLFALGVPAVKVVMEFVPTMQYESLIRAGA